MAISMRFSPYQVLHFIEALHRQQMVNAGVQSHLIENSHTGVHSSIEEKIRCTNKHSTIMIHAWKKRKRRRHWMKFTVCGTRRRHHWSVCCCSWPWPCWLCGLYKCRRLCREVRRAVNWCTDRAPEWAGPTLRDAVECPSRRHLCFGASVPAGLPRRARQTLKQFTSVKNKIPHETE